MKCKIILTVIIVFLMIMSGPVYETFRGPIEAEIAVNQIKDDAIAYALSRKVVVSDLLLNVFLISCIVFLCIIWIPTIVKELQKEHTK